MCRRCGKHPPAPERSVCASCGEKAKAADRARTARLEDGRMLDLSPGDPVCELAVAHVNSDRVEAAYWRSDLFDRRRAPTAAWAAYVTAR